MSGEPVITIAGNLTRDPELRFTQSGTAVADFSIAVTPRTYDRHTDEWRDGDPQFYRCSVWRDAAENAAETLRKGMRVIATGRVSLRSYETRDGQQRSELSLQVDEVGPSLRYARAQVTKTPAGDTQPAPQYQPRAQATRNAPAGGTHGDPWAQQSQPAFPDDPPF